MRIMYDTNVLISLIMFPSEHLNRMHEIVSSEHTLVLASYVVDELKYVAERKFHIEEIIDRFLMHTIFESVETPDDIPKGLFAIRDMKDCPVLYSAIVGDIDVLITGDKDFKDVDIPKPKILTPREFLVFFAL